MASWFSVESWRASFDAQYASERTRGSTAKVIQSHHRVLDDQQRRIEHLEKRADEERAKAQQWLSKKNRQRALECLKRKRLYEKQAANLQAMSSNIEQQQFAMQNSILTGEVARSMREGASAMRTIHERVSLDDVEETMLDIQEQMDEASAVQESISRPMFSSASEYDDEDALLAELEELTDDGLIEQLDNTSITNHVPSRTATTEQTHASPIIGGGGDDENDDDKGRPGEEKSDDERKMEKSDEAELEKLRQEMAL